MPKDKLLERVRGLLAKAEGTDNPQEAEIYFAKAAELMAKYGIERAMVGALHPETDKPGNRKVTVDNPYGDVKARFLGWLMTAMRGQAVLLTGTSTVHLFAYESDLDRVEMVYTSLLVQMHRAMVAAEANLDWYARKHIRAWRRSFMLGYAVASSKKVQAAEKTARNEAEADKESGTSTALVLVNRELAVKAEYQAAYPDVHQRRVHYSGTGYSKGYREGQKADIGGSKLAAKRGALSR